MIMGAGRTPSLCGEFLTDKRSMVAFTWSLTTVMTLFAFITAVILTIQVHAHYLGLKRYYDGDDWYSYDDDDKYNNGDDAFNRRTLTFSSSVRFLQGDDGEGEGEEEHNSRDEYQNEVREAYMRLANMNGIRSISFVAVYCMLLATGLCLYGSTAIVGFTSLRGVYISPCFDNPGNKLTTGIFGGAIVLFANLLLVCAVVLGEVRVADNKNNEPEGDREGNQDNTQEPFEVERVANILAVTCIFLSALYTIFSVLFFLCHANEEKAILRLEENDGTIAMVGVVSKSTPLVGMHHSSQLGNSPGFITMDNSSQGTSE